MGLALRPISVPIIYIDCLLFCVAFVLIFPRAEAGCFANGTVTGGDNAGDCAALLAAYAAWSNKPAYWTPNIAAGTSYCGWAGVYCSNGQVTNLCAARWPAQDCLRKTSCTAPRVWVCALSAVGGSI